MAAIRQNGVALGAASTYLRSHPVYVWEAVCRHGEALRFAPANRLADPVIVIAAVKDYGALRYASSELRNDPLIVGTALLSCRNLDEVRDLFKYVSVDLKQRLRAVLRKLVVPYGWDENERIPSETSLAGWAAFISFRNIPAVQAHAENEWRSPSRENIWLVNQALPPNVTDLHRRLIFEYAGIDKEFHAANELDRLAPVFGALYRRRVKYGAFFHLLVFG